MAEGRFVSRSIAHDLELNSVSLKADYLFTRCIPFLDREGRMEGHPSVVRAKVCPMRLDMSPEAVKTALAELQRADLVRWYIVDGRICLEFPGFDKNQKGLRKDREAESKIPPPEEGTPVDVHGSQLSMLPEKDAVGDEIRTSSGCGPEPSRNGPGEVEVKGSQGKSREVYDGGSFPAPNDLPKEGGSYVYPEPFEIAWEAYPDRAGGNPKKAAYRKWRARVLDGVDPEDLLEGVERYRRYCEAEGKVGRKFVMQARTFFGPDEHWREEYPLDAGDDPNREIIERRRRLESWVQEGEAR